VEHTLAELFPDVEIARVDRDTTRRKGALEGLLDGILARRYRILIGTQMLGKGHHFPGVTLVGVLSTDQGLFSTDFRAAERMAQLIVQVAGRAGREARRGEVLIQTHCPDHPLLHALLSRGYPAFAEAALAERRAAQFPPFGHFALLRAEAATRDAPHKFLNSIRQTIRAPDGIHLLGPVPAPMEKRAGRFRAQLLIHATHRGSLHHLLDEWLPHIEADPAARRVRWSLDVDPQDTY
jgi:primosomal protein N' (replication factor Y)